MGTHSTGMSTFLGAPGRGIHSVRFAGLAVVDVALAACAALALARWTRMNTVFALAVVALAGIVAHAVFGVDTALNVAMGLGVQRQRPGTAPGSLT